MKTIIAFAFGLWISLASALAQTGLSSAILTNFNKNDFDVTIPGTPTNVIKTVLSVNITPTGTNITIHGAPAAGALFLNPTVDYMPIRGATNFLDSPFFKQGSTSFGMYTNFHWDGSIGQFVITNRHEGNPGIFMKDYQDGNVVSLYANQLNMQPTLTPTRYFSFRSGNLTNNGVVWVFGSEQPYLLMSSNRNVVIGKNDVTSANRTTNYLYIPFGTGTPIGTPVLEGSHPAMYYDSTGDLLYVWNPATSWHIVGTNIFYGTNNFTINPTDGLVPYRVNATTLGDTGIYPTNSTDAAFKGNLLFGPGRATYSDDGTQLLRDGIPIVMMWTNAAGNYVPTSLQNQLTATNVQSVNTLYSLGAFMTPSTTSLALNPGLNTVNPNNLSALRLYSNVDETDPTTRTVSLASGNGNGQWLLLENWPVFGVTQSAFQITNGTPQYDDPTQFITLSRGDWKPTQKGELLFLHNNGLGWQEVDRGFGTAGGSPVELWTIDTNLNVLRPSDLGQTVMMTNGIYLSSGKTNLLTVSGSTLIYSNSTSPTATMQFIVQRANGDSGGFGVSQNGGALVRSLAGKDVRIGPNSDTPIYDFTANAFYTLDGLLHIGYLTNNVAELRLGTNSLWASYRDNGTTLTRNGVPLSGGSVTYASVTNALGLTGSTATYLRSDGTQATPPGGGGGNMTNSGPSVAGMIATATDTTGTQWTPTNGVPSLQADNLTVNGPMSVLITNQVLRTDGSGTVIGAGDPFVWTSQLPDNATNVAMVVNTANPWTGGKLLSLRNSSSNITEFNVNGGVDIGRNVIPKWNPDASDMFVGVYDASVGEPNHGWLYLNAVDDTASTTNQSEFEVYVDGTGNQSHFKLDNDDANYTSYVRWYVGHSNDGIHMTRFIIKHDATLATIMNPSVPDGGDNYYFDTAYPQTTGDILRVLNNTTNKFTVAYDGSVTVAGNVNVALTNFANYVYVTNDCSALTFTDRSESPTNLAHALAIVRSHTATTNGTVNHATLHPSAWGKKTVTTNGVQKIVPDQSQRNLSMMVSAQAMVIQDLEKRVSKLETEMLAVLGALGLGAAALVASKMTKKKDAAA